MVKEEEKQIIEKEKKSVNKEKQRHGQREKLMRKVLGSWKRGRVVPALEAISLAVVELEICLEPIM